MAPTAALLSGGQRLHLQHGPIDLIIGADGDRALAFKAAHARFATILSEIVNDLPILRSSSFAKPAQGLIGQHMQRAVTPFSRFGFVTAMASVAGTVAETVLAAMVDAASPARAYVNNGGDIALHLTQGQRFKTVMAGHDGQILGQIDIGADDPVRGIATSGRHGRSHSLGIADSVTVLASCASTADVAATMIANAVDLPGHPAITRTRADMLNEDTDLADQLVVTHCAKLSQSHTAAALANGEARARHLCETRQILGACLFLNGQTRTSGGSFTRNLNGANEYA